ncbi:MAG: acetyl-CoA carboxylase biotin carboxylase subunit [Candidatus Omnitrophica bacterium CG1_02_49_10]|nr:MAG: acetyl-CoA carboxylase biotin carboxylase subunit [Candidatus Omnitrophica bacterium CG1_02_49_10]
MFGKILIANRGEVAVRVIRACKELGIKTVAVYSQADADCLHTRIADEAVCIGSAQSAASYLNIPAIISAAEITDVEAIHPGYGFLAENAHFSEVCASCNIKFIGPDPESIRQMGDKIWARRAMKKAGLPIIPGSESLIKTKEEALDAAKRLRYPVIVKAAGGGGGRGMRVAHNDIRLVSSFFTAQSEAEAAFGSQDVYIEKYIERPRHIEFQILADKHGHVVHLGERDCTIQRRHQKLIEEAPSSSLDSRMRKKMGELAVNGAKAVNYTNAGTIEFLLDENDNFYFMEMNTRIQVEHPVTEMVTGIDLIKEQIRLTAGERLGFEQDDVKINGYSIECRVNCEDPYNDFAPSPGVIDTYNVPGGRGVRIDTHLYPGYRVPPYYDSLLAKLITHGKNRTEAIKIMQRALDEYVIEPIKTTIPLYKSVFANPVYLQAGMRTDFMDTLLENTAVK